MHTQSFPIVCIWSTAGFSKKINMRSVHEGRTKNKYGIVCVVCQYNHIHFFPLAIKTAPVVRPSSPRARPTPQNTDGPMLGSVISTSAHTDIQYVFVKFIVF